MPHSKPGRRFAIALLPALGLALLAPPLARGDSGPDAERCAAEAEAYANQEARTSVSGEDVAGAAMDGAVVGGLAGRGPGDWSARGAARGARLGGGLATLDALSNSREQDWQALYAKAYYACLAGEPRPLTRQERCGSSAIVTGAGQGPLIGTSSRQDCR
ncbi:hypothetical protein [Stappia indica]|uniref:hypothetical protein n=1 Tax=Stappia indica TaxID=538381 RepID=UPI001CD2C9DD|nr:hypothetical protein [Stappia indica]MCA1297510.1 hypothetical protein [Stappia indica]